MTKETRPMETHLYTAPKDFAARAHADAAEYSVLYKASVEDPEGFWAEQGKRLDWIKPFTQVKDVSYDAGDLHVKWYQDGVLNA
ncbi:MAG: acetyl-coenzyme A synthetase N-terminal domain-containing protein, partial [Pseudomonadota bacterium]